MRTEPKNSVVRPSPKSECEIRVKNIQATEWYRGSPADQRVSNRLKMSSASGVPGTMREVLASRPKPEVHGSIIDPAQPGFIHMTNSPDGRILEGDASESFFCEPFGDISMKSAHAFPLSVK